MARQGIINQTAGATMADDVVTALNNTNKLLEDFLKKFEEQQKTLEKRRKEVIDLDQKTQTILGEVKKNIDLNLGEIPKTISAYIIRKDNYDKKEEKEKKDISTKAMNFGRNITNTQNAYFQKQDKRFQEYTQKSKLQEDFERTKYVARQLWESQITSSIKDIIDNQIKQMNEMGKQRGLDREETVKLYQDINGIRQNLNIKGGYLFSNEQVRQAMEALAKTNLSFSEQKAYAGVMTQATAFFPGAQGFENIIAKYNIIADGANKTQEQITKSLDATLGFSANLHKRLGKEYTQGEMLNSLNADRLGNASKLALEAGVDQTQGLKIEQAVSAELTIIGKRLGRNVAEGVSKIMNQTLTSMADPTAEGAGEYYKQVSLLLQGTGSKFAGKSMEDVRRFIAEDPESFYKEIIEPIMRKAAEGDMASSQFLSTNMDKKTIQELQLGYKGERRLKVMSEMKEIQEALGETEEQNIKHLKELNDTMAQHQTWLEKLKVGFNNLVNDSAIGQFITSLGIGRFSIADIVLGGSAVQKGVTRIGNIFGEKGLNIGEKLKDSKWGSRVLSAGKKTGGLLKGVGTKALKGIPLLGALLSGGLLVNDAAAYTEATNEEDKQKTAREAANTTVQLAGATIGGLVGSIIPGLGTVIGSLVGGLIGTLVSKLDFIMEPVKESIIPILDDLKPEIEYLSNKGKAFFSWLKKKGGELKDNIPVIISGVGKAIRFFIFGIRQIGTSLSGITKGIIGGTIKFLGQASDFLMLPSSWGRKLSQKGDEFLSGAGDSFNKVDITNRNYWNDTGEYSNAPGKRLGEAYVPEDNALRRLHKGEMVLTHSLADVFRSGVYRDIFRMAEEEANGRKANPENVVLKWLKGVDKNLVSKSLVNYIEQGMNTLEAKDLFEKNDIGTVMIISGLRSLEKQKNLQKGRGAKNSAHLVGGAVDYNFISNDGTWYKAWNGTHTPNPKYEAVYRAFGDIISYVSGGEVKNGANFNTVDINHIQLADASKKAAMLRRRYEYEMNRQENELYYNKQALGNFLGELESKERGQTMFVSDQELERLWRSKEEHERKNKEKEMYNRQSIDDYFGREEVSSYGMTMASPYTR